MKSIIASLIVALTLIIPNLSWAEPIDINKADSDEIAAELVGIGLKKADAIVAYRQQNGPYQSMDELLEVKGIGERTLERNKDNFYIQLKSK